MNKRRRQRAILFMLSLMVVVSSPGWGQGEQLPKIGPPQVIELPLPEALPSPPEPAWPDDTQVQSSQDQAPLVPSRPSLLTRRGYLGVRYATAEAGHPGVRVLGVIEGSPAERAGFSATPHQTRLRQVLEVATIILAFSPAGPLALPLMIAQEQYDRELPEAGDLIVAVEGQPVRNVQEFNDRMHSFGPGDTVTFVVQRGETRILLTAQLEAEPQ